LIGQGVQKHVSSHEGSRTRRKRRKRRKMRRKRRRRKMEAWMIYATTISAVATKRHFLFFFSFF